MGEVRDILNQHQLNNPERDIRENVGGFQLPQTGFSPLSPRIQQGVQLQESEEVARAQPVEDPDPEGLRILANLATALTVGAATGGASLPAQIAAQAGAAFGTNVAADVLLEDRPLGEAAKRSIDDAAVAGGGEALVGAVNPVLGGAVRLTRRGFQKAAGRARAAVSQRQPVQPGRGTLSAPNRSRLVPGAEAASQTADRLNVIIPPGNLVEARTTDLAQNIVQSSIVAGGRLDRLRLGGVQAAESAMNRVLNSFPRMSRAETMKLVQDLTGGQLAEVKGVAGGLFRSVDEQMSGSNVDIRILKAMARKQLDKQRQGILGVDSRVGEILNKEDLVSFSEAQQIRSDLFDISNQFDVGQSVTVGRDKQAAIALSTQVTKAIQNAVSKAGPGVKDQLNMANRIWRQEVKGTFTNKLVRKIIDEQPDDILDSLLTSGSVGSIKSMRKIVQRADPSGRAWGSVQGRLLERVFQASSKPVIAPGGRPIRGATRVDGDTMLKELEKIGGTDDAMIQAFFPGNARQTVENLREYANMLKFVQNKAGGTEASTIFFNILQAGAIAGVPAGTYMMLGGGGEAGGFTEGLTTLGGSAAILLSPKAVERILTNRDTAKWLSVGVSATPGSRQASRALINVVGNLLVDDLIEPEQRPAAEAAVRRAQENLGGGVPNIEASVRDPATRRLLERAKLRQFDAIQQQRAQDKRNNP